MARDLFGGIVRRGVAAWIVRHSVYAERAQNAGGVVMQRVIFACGAFYDLKETSWAKGKRVMTMATSDTNKITRPSIPDDVCIAEGLPIGSVANCLLMCPAKVKDSGRKAQRAYIGNDSNVSFCVTCKIKEVV